MAFFYVTAGDLGFKMVNSDTYPDPEDRLLYHPFIFMRSEMEKAVRTRLPQTLYLRSVSRGEDYMIEFQSAENMNTFLQLFPDRLYDEYLTGGYYYTRAIPGRQRRRDDSQKTESDVSAA